MPVTVPKYVMVEMPDVDDHLKLYDLIEDASKAGEHASKAGVIRGLIRAAWNKRQKNNSKKSEKRH